MNINDKKRKYDDAATSVKVQERKTTDNKSRSESENVSKEPPDILQQLLNCRPADPVAATKPDFLSMADLLLNNSILFIKDIPHRLCEVEFYYNGEGHRDLYAHCHPDQIIAGNYYFHRYLNGTYRNGTWKGMDIGVGSADPLVHFGILIRSLEVIGTGEFTEGPCKCVNKILDHHGVTSVRELMDSLKTEALSLSHETLRLQHAQLERLPLFAGKRVGLSAAHPELADRPYRFAINIHKLKKLKKFLKPVAL
jgi:hypothetical protein